MGHYDECRDGYCGICGQTNGNCAHSTKYKKEKVCSYNINEESRKFLIEKNLKLDYDSAENVPLIFNGYPIGIVKKYYDNFVECILWDQFTGVEAQFENGKDGIIKSVMIGTKDEKLCELIKSTRDMIDTETQ